VGLHSPSPNSPVRLVDTTVRPLRNHQKIFNATRNFTLRSH
jgi:hypothetical protein